MADDYAWDELVFLTEDPVQLEGRGSLDNLLGPGNAFSEFKWQGHGKTLQVGAQLYSPNTSVIGWGGAYRPFMKNWPADPIKAGAPFTVQGKMGPELYALVATLFCESTGQTFQVRNVAWGSGAAVFTPARRVPPGDYLFYFEARDGDSSIVSNTIRLTVEDSYQIWRATTFSAGELLDPAISGTEVDLDGDGLPVIGEFAAGGDPRIAEPHLLPCIVGTGSSVKFQAPVLEVTSGVTVDFEYSVDLLNWNISGPSSLMPNHLGNPDLMLWSTTWTRATPRRYFRVLYTELER